MLECSIFVICDMLVCAPSTQSSQPSCLTNSVEIPAAIAIDSCHMLPFFCPAPLRHGTYEYLPFDWLVCKSRKFNCALVAYVNVFYVACFIYFHLLIPFTAIHVHAIHIYVHLYAFSEHLYSTKLLRVHLVILSLLQPVCLISLSFTSA